MLIALSSIQHFVDLPVVNTIAAVDTTMTAVKHTSVEVQRTAVRHMIAVPHTAFGSHMTFCLPAHQQMRSRHA